MKQRLAGLLIAVVLGGAVILFNRNNVEWRGQGGFQLNRLSASGYQLESNLVFYNPNLLSSTILTIREEYYLNGHMVSVMNVELNQGIPGRKETTLPLTVRFDEETLQQALGANSSNNLEIQVKGEITYKNLTGGGTLPVDTTQTINFNGI